jgi:hypothetical protein
MAKEVHSAEYLNLKKDAAWALEQKVTAWLVEQAAGQPGYGTFKDSRNKVLQNPETVKMWNFVATFAAMHVGKSFRIPVRYDVATC